jgi:hypothetical protein
MFRTDANFSLIFWFSRWPNPQMWNPWIWRPQSSAWHTILSGATDLAVSIKWRFGSSNYTELSPRLSEVWLTGFVLPGEQWASVNPSSFWCSVTNGSSMDAWVRVQTAGRSQQGDSLPIASLNGKEGWAWWHHDCFAERCSPSTKPTPGLAERPLSYRPREASDWGGCFLHGRKMPVPLNPAVWDTGGVGKSGHRAREVGGRRTVWEEWRDGRAPTAGDSAPCLEVC